MTDECNLCGGSRSRTIRASRVLPNGCHMSDSEQGLAQRQGGGGTKRLRGWLLLLLNTLLCVSACNSRDQASQIVMPSDPDYPKVNPHPRRAIEFTALVPPRLTVKFQSAWTGYSCNRTVGLAVQAPAGLDLPVQLARSNGSYAGEVVMDHFDPGHCGWAFTGFGFTTTNPASTAIPILSYSGRPDARVEYQMDVWCIYAPKQWPDRPEVCASLKFLSEGRGLVSRQLVNSAPEDQRDDAGPVQIGPNTRIVTLRIHDLDATP